MSGTVRFANSQLDVTFSNTHAQILPVLYDLDKVTWKLVPPSNGGITTIQGAVTVVPLPATASMGLLLLGSIAGLGLIRRLRNGPAVVA